MSNTKNKAQLKKTVQSIIIGQGNDFIKELLRDNGIKIGINKADFLRNMLEAIDEERLTSTMLEDWLNKVEGWGDQHVYLYRPPLHTAAQIRKMVSSSDYASLLDHTSTHEFPTDLKITNIIVTDTLISFSWHQGNKDWLRVKPKDFTRNEGGDLYEYRAYRQISDRTVVRFEWHISEPYCAIFMQQPNTGTLHEDILKKVMGVLREIGVFKSPLQAVSINNAVNTMSAPSSRTTATSRRLWAEGGHVDLVSDLPDSGINDIAAIRKVNRSANPSDFQSAEGKFKLTHQIHTSLSKDIKLEVFGIESRIRIWVKCKRDDVYSVINIIWASN